MMNPKEKFGIAAVGSSALLLLTSIVGALANIKDVRELLQLNYISVSIGLLALGGIIVNFMLWRNYKEATREFALVSYDKGIALGARRSEIEIAKKIREMTQNKNISEIDIGGLALRANFFAKTAEFRHWLFDFLKENKHVKVRIWLLDPSSSACIQREIAERGMKGAHLQVACQESLETLKDIVVGIWKDQNERRPNVVLVNQVAITHFIFRVDTQMIVCPYLQHTTGNNSPTFYLRDGNYWFSVYKKQFDTCFEQNASNQYPPEASLV